MILFIILFIQFRPRGIIALAAARRGIEGMGETIFLRNRSVMIFIGILALFTWR
jgi:hypothetical protein